MNERSIIRFVDVNTGNVYDGAKPYIHCFDGKQSIGLNYDKQFIVLTTDPSLHIFLESEVFFLVDPTKLSSEQASKTLFDKKYIDLQEITTDFLELAPATEYEGYNLFTFNVIACGKYVGEVTDKLTINSQDFDICADFVDENESLSVNLKNFGVEMSNEIQRAIYEKRIDEQKTDFVLLNRKYKELLNEYTNILANKGSYKSLINSLKWFEYGDIVQIYEYWKHEEPNKDYLSRRDLTQLITQKTESLLYSMQKTTYTGVSAALEKMKRVNGSVVFEKDKYGEPTYWGYNPLNYDNFHANVQWCTIYNEDKTVTFKLAVDKEITGFAPQISFAGIYVGMYRVGDHYEYTTPETYEKGELLPEVWFFWLASYYGVVRIDIPYLRIGSENDRDSITLPTGWSWIITGGKTVNSKILAEPNPILENVSMLWSKNEMQLKMVLLGNFFATYFLPIHLDLIHSTIEDVVYSQTLKMHTGAFHERFDTYDNMRAMSCPLEKVYHLTNVETITNLNTPFGFTNKDKLTSEDEELKILCVDTQEDYIETLENLEEHNKAYNLQHFKGIGVIIPFKCTLYDFDEHEVITSGEIYVYKNKKLIVNRTTSNIPNIPTEKKLHIDFNILVQQIGEYKVQLAFKCSDGSLYTKTVDFIVDTEIYQNIEMYKLVKKNNLSFEVNNINRIVGWIAEDGVRHKVLDLDKNIADYVLSPIQYHKYLEDCASEQPNEYVEDPTNIYMQFIACNGQNSAVQTNQVVIIEYKSWTGDTSDNSVNTNLYRVKVGNIRATLTDAFFWVVMNRYGQILRQEPEENPDVLVEFGGDQTKYLVGICKYFNRHYDVTVEPRGNTQIKDKIWKRDMFVPFFYTLEKIGQTSFFEKVKDQLSEEDIFRKRVAKNTYTISQDDVVCFLPDIKCIQRPRDFMWKYVCETNNKEITPITYRTKDGKDWPSEDNIFPSILQPLFGRYDFRVLQDPGYYSVTCNYKMDQAQAQNLARSISSQFLVVKPSNYKSAIKEDE